jgi:NAD(P)-dependent dehydrogenase (short-subunit alcohol dehydrogenase family)
MSERRSAIVTGASRGIGAATAQAMAADGWDLLLTFASQRDQAEEVASACQALGVRAECMQVDVANEADIVALFKQMDASFGRLDALINNAGVVDAKSRVDELTLRRINRMFAINVTGTILCCREAVLRMSTNHGGVGGVIVNVGSAASRLGAPGEYVDYAASKAAVDTFTLGLAKEVAAEGIRVNCVRPGIVETEIHASGGQPDRVQRMAPLVPMQRAGLPVEIADMIAFACSPKSSFMTGALIDVSGGR